MKKIKFVCMPWLIVLWHLIFVVSLQAQSPVEYWVGGITVGDQTIIVRVNHSTAFVYQNNTIFAQNLVNQTFVVNEMPFVVHWEDEQVIVTQAGIPSEFSAVVPMLDKPYEFLGYYETTEEQGRSSIELIQCA